MSTGPCVHKEGAKGASSIPYFQKLVTGQMGSAVPFLEIKRGQVCSAPFSRRLGTDLVKDIILFITLL